MNSRDLANAMPVPIQVVRQHRSGEPMMTKVPQITVLFWVIKILSTGMGESASDWALKRGQGLPVIGIAGTLGLDTLIFVGALVLQFSRRRYIPAVYWFAVVGVSIFGTVAADVVHFIIGVPLWATTAAYAGALVVDFGLWYLLEKTLSVHSINTRRRETFYWIAVFFTFALGTALGDVAATTRNLGFFLSGVFFAVLIMLPAIGHRWLGLNANVAFWCAYVLTRPLGASFADWLAVAPNESGLGLGAGWVTLVATIVIVGLVSFEEVQHKYSTTVGERDSLLAKRIGSATAPAPERCRE
jgi:uncharacterized membrane-anchored protein